MVRQAKNPFERGVNEEERTRVGHKASATWIVGQIVDVVKAES